MTFISGPRRVNFLFGSEARSYRDYANLYGSSRDYRQTDMAGAFSDWAQDRSGGGCCCGGGYGGGGYSSSPSLFSDGTLFALLAAAGLAFYILYSTVTNAAAGTGGRRKRRSLMSLSVQEKEEDFGVDPFEHFIGLGRFIVSITAGQAW